MKAMILGAGKGTRLGKITESIPKVLVEINGKTMLQHAVEKCTNAGFDDIIVNVHHFAGMVKEEIQRLNRKGFRISISDESDCLLETGGGLFKARWFFDQSPFLLYNADIVTDLDLSGLFSYHNKMKGIATLAVRNRKGNRYFLVNREGMLKGWCNKATGERIIVSEENDELKETGFSGIHIIDPGIFNYMYEGIYSMTSLYLEIAAKRRIYTYLINDGFWGDIGTPENLEEIRRHLKNENPPQPLPGGDL
jgi:NDP-sugar pyrophosphorylase family protein